MGRRAARRRRPGSGAPPPSCLHAPNPSLRSHRRRDPHRPPARAWRSRRPGAREDAEEAAPPPAPPPAPSARGAGPTGTRSASVARAPPVGAREKRADAEREGGTCQGTPLRGHDAPCKLSYLSVLKGERPSRLRIGRPCLQGWHLWRLSKT